MSKYLWQIFITSHIKFIIYVTVIRNAKTCYKNYISKSSKHPNLTYCQNVQCTKLKAQVSSLHPIFKIKTIYFTLLYSIQRVVPKIIYVHAINSLKNCKKKSTSILRAIVKRIKPKLNRQISWSRGISRIERAGRWKSIKYFNQSPH